MKKTIITLAATMAIAIGAMAQGSISGIGGALNNGNYGWFVTGVGNQQAGSGYYVGGLTASIFFSSSATSGNDTTLNGYNGTAGGGDAAQALLSGFGFQSVATVSGVSSTANSGSTGWATTYNLSSAFAPSTAGSYALVFTGVGAFSTYSSVVAWTGSYGGNPAGTPPGTPYNAAPTAAPFSGIQNFANAANIDMVTSVPEPATMALFALGGASVLLFRRRK
jgi:hypothetical protein